MKMLIASIPLAALPALSFATETCSIEVGGLLYHYGECRYSKTLSSDRSWSIEIGSEKAEDESLDTGSCCLKTQTGNTKAIGTVRMAEPVPITIYMR